MILQVPPDEAAPALDPQVARQRADATLTGLGYDLSRFAEPEVRTEQLQARTDLTFRYRDREALLGSDAPYGFKVTFAGDRATGYDSFYDPPPGGDGDGSLQLLALIPRRGCFSPSSCCRSSPSPSSAATTPARSASAAGWRSSPSSSAAPWWCC